MQQSLATNILIKHSHDNNNYDNITSIDDGSN